MLSTADTDCALDYEKQQLPRSWRSLVIREVPSSVEARGIHSISRVPLPVAWEITSKSLRDSCSSNNSCFKDLLGQLNFYKAFHN